MSFRAPRFFLVAGLSLLASPLWALEATGLVQPVWEATLAATVLGRVERICVQEGSLVEAGTVLIEMEREGEKIDAARRKIVFETTVEVEAARARREVLKDDLAGTQKLYDSTRSVSRDDMAKKTLEFKLAEAEFEQLNQRKKIEQLEYDFAIEQVKRRELTAPQKGVVVEIMPKVGEVCEARQPLVRMIDASTVRIVLDIDPLRVPGLAVGQTVPVKVNGVDGPVTADGKIEFIAPAVDAASGLRRVRVGIDNRDQRLLPGLPAVVTLGGKE